MRIALVHSFYASANPSGENVIVAEQARALVEAGHEVAVVARHTDDECRQALYPVVSALRVMTGRGTSPVAELRAFEPDVVHVHNLFPNFGTRWLADWDGPLVATLHNYRYACANALLMRDGQWCTECADTGSSAAVRHGCYRGSRAASLPLAIATRNGFAAHPVVQRADRLITLSPTAEALFLRFGAPADRLRLVPNFVRALHEGATKSPAAERYLAVGRLSAEKGFAELAGSWPAGRPLDIIGRAVGDAAVTLPTHPDVRLLGAVDNAEWRMRLADYTAVIMPGRSAEGAVPLVAVEAWEAGVPVVAARPSGLAAYVENGGAGAVYDNHNGSLAGALDLVFAEGQFLREHARAAYETSFAEPTWLDAIDEVYGEAVSSR